MFRRGKRKRKNFASKTSRKKRKGTNGGIESTNSGLNAISESNSSHITSQQPNVTELDYSNYCYKCKRFFDNINYHYAKNINCAYAKNALDSTKIVNISSLTRGSPANKICCSTSKRNLNTNSDNKAIINSFTLQTFQLNDIDDNLVYYPNDDEESSSLDRTNIDHNKTRPKDSSNNHRNTESLHQLSSKYQLTSMQQMLKSMRSLQVSVSDTLHSERDNINSYNKSDDTTRDMEKSLVNSIEHIQRTISDEVDISNDSDEKHALENFNILRDQYKEDNLPVFLYNNTSKPKELNTNSNNDSNLSSQQVDNKEDNSLSKTDTTQHVSNETSHSFVSIQVNIAQAHSNIKIDSSMIAAIHLLYIMHNGNIAASKYPELISWHEETMSNFLSLANTKSDVHCTIPRSSKSVIDKCMGIVFNASPQYTLRPIHSVVQVPSKKFSRVSTFDFKSMVLSLLTDLELTQPDNLLVENEDYLNPGIHSGKPDNEQYYNDVHTGSWFYNAHDKLCKDPVNDVLCPIILFIDGTPIDVFGNLKLESVMFTLGIYNRETRNKQGAWRMLGYIPDTSHNVLCPQIFDDSEDDEPEQVNGSRPSQVVKREDYHHLLQHILTGLFEVEQSNGIVWRYIDSNSNSHVYNLKFALMYVIGDALGNDKLCDRYLTYNSKSKFLCRDCNCPSSELDNPDFICEYILRKTILSMNSNELKQKCFYKVTNNAFDRTCFGHDEYGIHGCSPAEFLHQFLLGVLKKLLSFFFDSVTQKGLEVLDKVAVYLAMNWHRQSDKDLPNIQMFKDGIQKTQLTGDEVVSQVFMLYLVMSQSYTIREFMKAEQSCNRRFVYRKVQRGAQTVSEKIYFDRIGESISSIKQWIKLFEASLAFWSWLKQDKIPYSDLKLSQDDDNVNLRKRNSKADISIKTYMKLYYKIVKPPSGGHGIKPHQTFHIPHNIRRFGSPLNFDGGIGERHLKSMTKIPARMTQKRSLLLAEQATERYSERLAVQSVYRLLVNNDMISDDNMSCNPYKSEATTLKQAYCVRNESGKNNAPDKDLSDYYTMSGPYKYVLHDNGLYDKVIWDKRKQRRISHKKKLVEEVFKHLKGPEFMLKDNFLTCFTTLKVNVEGQQRIFRADPYFFKKVWFDWCITKWEFDDEGDSNCEDSITEFPARILMFIDPSGMEFQDQKTVNKKGKYWAVVRCTDQDLRKRNENFRFATPTLSKCYTLENSIRIISCQNIVREVFVYPDLKTISTNHNNSVFDHYDISHIFAIDRYNSWPDKFINTRWE